MFKTILKLSRIRYFDMKYISGYIYSKLISDLVHGFSQQNLNTLRFVLKELSFLFIKTTFVIFESVFCVFIADGISNDVASQLANEFLTQLSNQIVNDLTRNVEALGIDTVAPSSNERLTFHERCGSLVKLSNSRRTAERRHPLDEFNNGVVMTNRPLKNDELFEVSIELDICTESYTCKTLNLIKIKCCK